MHLGEKSVGMDAGGNQFVKGSSGDYSVVTCGARGVTCPARCSGVANLKSWPQEQLVVKKAIYLHQRVGGAGQGSRGQEGGRTPCLK